jgi:hypothetical protein
VQSLGNAFPLGAFAAARATPINPKYSGAVFRSFPLAPNTWRLNILPLGQFRPGARPGLGESLADRGGDSAVAEPSMSAGWPLTRRSIGPWTVSRDV